MGPLAGEAGIGEPSCLTATHAELLKKHLIEFMMDQMSTEGTVYYKAEWAAAAAAQKQSASASKAPASSSGTPANGPDASERKGVKAKAVDRKRKTKGSSESSEANKKAKKAERKKAKKKAASSSDSES